MFTGGNVLCATVHNGFQTLWEIGGMVLEESTDYIEKNSDECYKDGIDGFWLIM